MFSNVTLFLHVVLTIWCLASSATLKAVEISEGWSSWQLVTREIPLKVTDSSWLCLWSVLPGKTVRTTELLWSSTMTTIYKIMRQIDPSPSAHYFITILRKITHTLRGWTIKNLFVKYMLLHISTVDYRDLSFFFILLFSFLFWLVFYFPFYFISFLKI